MVASLLRELGRRWQAMAGCRACRLAGCVGVRLLWARITWLKSDTPSHSTSQLQGGCSGEKLDLLLVYTISAQGWSLTELVCGGVCVSQGGVRVTLEPSIVSGVVLQYCELRALSMCAAGRLPSDW